MSLQEVLDAVHTYYQYSHANEIQGSTTPLFHAFYNGRDDLVRILIERHGADLNVRLGNSPGITYVYAIERAQSVAIVRYCIARGACRESLERLLHYVAVHERPIRKAIVCCLLDAGYKFGAALHVRALWVERFIAWRNAAKRTIAIVIGLRSKNTLLRAVGRDVVQLIACAMWEMREPFVDE